MDTVWAFIEKKMRDWLIDAIMNNLEPMFASVQSQTAELQGVLTQSPSDYAGGSMWNTAVNVGSTVMMPIAALLLTAVMCIELIGWINEKNNMHSSADVVWLLMRTIIKMLIGVILVQKAPVITEGIFQLGTYIVAQVPGGTDTGFGAAELGAMKLLLEEQAIGYLITMLVYSMIGRVGIIIISLVIQLVVIGRMFKICLYCSMGALPYATILNKEMSGIGTNYIKNLFALAFQGFFMFVIVVMYAALTQNVVISSDPNDAIFKMMTYSLVFVYALFNTMSLAKSIFNAH